jgi:hypothetical protein
LFNLNLHIVASKTVDAGVYNMKTSHSYLVFQTASGLIIMTMNLSVVDKKKYTGKIVDFKLSEYIIVLVKESGFISIVVLRYQGDVVRSYKTDLVGSIVFMTLVCDYFVCVNDNRTVVFMSLTGRILNEIDCSNAQVRVVAGNRDKVIICYGKYICMIE